MPISLHAGPLERLSPEDKIRQIQELFHKLEDHINAQVEIYVKFSEKQKNPEFKKYDLLLDLVASPGFLTIFEWNGQELVPLAGGGAVGEITFDDITGDLDIVDRGVGSGTDDTLFLKSDGAEHWVLAALNLLLYGTGSGGDPSLFLKSDGAGGWELAAPTMGSLSFDDITGFLDLVARGIGSGTDNSLFLKSDGAGGWELAPATTTDTSNQLISGGGVFWTGDLDFTVSAATYQIAGVIYNSIQTDVSLDTADPTDDRIDIIAVDDTGAVVVITGTPAPVPAAPDVDPLSQLQLTFIFVAAGATVPVITNEDIYLENAEYTTSTNSAGTINLASTSNPFAGTKDIEATLAVANNRIFFQRPAGTVNLADFSTLTLNLRSKAAWPTAKGLTLTWMMGAAVVGIPVVIKSGTFGFLSSNTTTYQQITIPVGFFSTGSLTVDRLRLNVTGGGAAIGFYLDNVILQGGIAEPPPPDPTVDELTVTLTNGDAVSHTLGKIVYISAANTAKLAKADASGTKGAVAFATTTIAPAATGTYQLAGIMSGLSGLTAGAVYYLSVSVSGGMTSVAPTAYDDYVVRLGIAISTTDFLIQIERPILL